MKIEYQVCSLEQAKKLKELGVAQNSLFVWRWFLNNSETSIFYGSYIETGYLSNLQWASAFTVAELGAMLPAWITEKGKHFRLKEWRNEKGMFGEFSDFRICYQDEYDENGRIPTSIIQKTEAEARSVLLIHIIEKKLITVEQVNERLK